MSRYADDGALRERIAAVMNEHRGYEEWVGYPMTACTCGEPWGADHVAYAIASALDSTPASDGGECPHIVTSDEGTSEAALGLALLDNLASSPMDNRVAAGQFLGWATRHLRPILLAADPGAAE